MALDRNSSSRVLPPSAFRLPPDSRGRAALRAASFPNLPPTQSLCSSRLCGPHCGNFSPQRHDERREKHSEFQRAKPGSTIPLPTSPARNCQNPDQGRAQRRPYLHRLPRLLRPPLRNLPHRRPILPKPSRKRPHSLRNLPEPPRKLPESSRKLPESFWELSQPLREPHPAPPNPLPSPT